MAEKKSTLGNRMEAENKAFMAFKSEREMNAYVKKYNKEHNKKTDNKKSK